MIDDNISDDLDVVVVAFLDQLTQVSLAAVCTVQLVQVPGQVALQQTTAGSGCEAGLICYTCTVFQAR